MKKLKKGKVSNLDNPYCDIEVNLGGCKMPLKEVKSLTVGSIFKLDEKPIHPTVIKINGIASFRGDVVVIDENFGIRVSEIIS